MYGGKHLKQGLWIKLCDIRSEKSISMLLDVPQSIFSYLAFIPTGNLRSAGKDAQYRLDDLNSSAADIKGKLICCNFWKSAVHDTLAV